MSYHPPGEFNVFESCRLLWGEVLQDCVYCMQVSSLAKL